MAQIFKNNVWGQLASELASGATTATLSAGHGYPDPGTDWYLATLIGVTGTTETSWEIVKVTDVSTNTLTIVRAQEGTTDTTWPVGTRIELRLTAGATESKANLGSAAYTATTAYATAAQGSTADSALQPGDVDDVPVNGAADVPVSSNWAFDHAAATAAHGVSGAVVGTSDTQTLTNKTISADSNTLSGIAASSFVLSNASGNIDGSAAQKVIPAGAVVGTTDTQTLDNKSLSSLNGGPLAGFRNRIINGGFAINQRNADVVTADASFPADRFRTYPYGTGYGYVVAMSNPPQVSGFTHFLNFVRTADGNGSSYVSQHIEDVKSLSGKQMTFSFWIRGDVIPGDGFTVWASAHKTDTTFIAYSPNSGTAFSITGTWTKVSMRMDVPTISVDPGAGGGYLWIMLRCSSASQNFNIQTTGWQFEEGTVATPFEHRPYGVELALCQRYYKRFTGVALPIIKGPAADHNYTVLLYESTYRSAPTIAHNLTNATFAATGATNTWGLLVPGVTFITKTGTITATAIGTNISISGATLSDVPTSIVAYGDRYIEASSEI